VFCCVFVDILAPPALPIPGLQQVGRSPTLAAKSQQAASVPNTQPPVTSSKSLPATPASTPQVEQQPTGFMSRLFGSSNKQNKPATNEQTAGTCDVIGLSLNAKLLYSVFLIVCVVVVIIPYNVIVIVLLSKT